MSAELKERVAELEERVAELEEMVDGAEVMPSRSDLEEFLDLVSPGTHIERATAIGYHIVHEQERGPFTVADVKEAYADCRLTQPANMSDVLAGAEERGWLIRAGSQGQNTLWNVSRDGDEVVQEGFEQ